jgi:outer membrane lipoprotein LolB
LRTTLAALSAGLMLAGCALAPAQPAPAREGLRDFTIEARFALRVTRPEQVSDSSSGRLAWERRGERDRILVANPLGAGLAEIDSDPGGARLRTADGQVREAASPDDLLETVTGQRLPVRRLSGWLLGRGGPSARIERDALGRPVRLEESGWRIDYVYGNDDAQALPSGVTLARPGEIELRLRIEDWREAE